ncbi:MAG: hypothetical protein ABFD60_09195 [Bryobacteraceae bacterium]
MTARIESYASEPDVRRFLAVFRGEKTDRMPHLDRILVSVREASLPIMFHSDTRVSWP